MPNSSQVAKNLRLDRSRNSGETTKLLSCQSNITTKWPNDWCCPHRSVPCSTLIREASSCTGSTQRPQLNSVQTVTDLETLSPEWDVSIKSIPLGLRERRHKVVGARGDEGHKERVSCRYNGTSVQVSTGRDKACTGPSPMGSKHWDGSGHSPFLAQKLSPTDNHAKRKIVFSGILKCGYINPMPSRRWPTKTNSLLFLEMFCLIAICFIFVVFVSLLFFFLPCFLLIYFGFLIFQVLCVYVTPHVCVSWFFSLFSLFYSFNDCSVDFLKKGGHRVGYMGKLGQGSWEKQGRRSHDQFVVYKILFSN